MISPPPALGSWIRVKLKRKDITGRDVWMGQVENVSEYGVTLNNGVSAAGGGAVSATVLWDVIDGYQYFKQDEPGNYYVGLIA